MPGQKRLKDRATGVKNFFRSLVPDRSRSPSPLPNRPITPTLDPQASSTPVGPDSSPDTQPLNSPSSNIYSSIVKPEEDKGPEGKADLASTVFQGVKTTLQLVETVADACPPLKSTIAGLLGVIDIVEVRNYQGCDRDGVDRSQTIAQNQQDRQDLAQKLEAVVSIIKSHATSSTFTTRLEGLSS
jgi:hypothetical protein